jgi:TetR/AcrR family transcriptional repressor of nem operon
MPRYSPQQKQASRDAILASAARFFRLKGYEGVGIPEIAQGAGLTHGTFYAHFSSKDELLREVIHDAREKRNRKIHESTRSANLERARSVVAYYLGEDHALTLERGCILPALGAELSRKKGRTSEQTTAYVESFVDEFMACGLRRAQARHVAATLVGGVIAARLIEKEKRAEFLRDVRHECLHGIEREKFR